MENRKTIFFIRFFSAVILLFILGLPLVSSQTIFANPPEKVIVCHRIDSQTNPVVVISVDKHALEAHLSHGDTLAVDGECPIPVGSVKVRVVASDGVTPLPNAQVSSSEVSGFTNLDGFVTLENLPAQRQVITAHLLGYAKNFKVVTVVKDQTVPVLIMLKQIQAEAIFNKVTGGQVSSDVDGDGKVDVEINFAGGAFLGLGDVTVRVTTGDPTNLQDRLLFPGDFRAMEQTGNPTLLESVFFADISAFSEGNSVSVLTKPAQTCFKVPSSLESTYPEGSKIPTYSFDTNFGTWVREQGMSTVVAKNDQLMACFSLTHLSWWNVDKPIETHTTIWGKISDPEGNPFAYISVAAEGVSYVGYSGAITDLNGEFCIDVKRSMETVETVKLRVAWTGYYATAAPNPDNQKLTVDASLAAVVTTPGTQATCPQKVKYVGTLRYPGLKLKEVSFKDDYENFWANEESLLQIQDPAFVRNPDTGQILKSVPVVYKRGIPFKLGPTKFKVENPPVGNFPVAVSGVSFDPFDFDTQTALDGTNELAIDNISASMATDKVMLLEPYLLIWGYTYDNGFTNFNAGGSKNTVYVTLRQPNPMQLSSDPAHRNRLYLTVVDHAVRPAVNKTTADEVLNAVWDRVKNLNAAGVPAAGSINKKILNPTTGALSNGVVLTYYTPGGDRVDCPPAAHPPAMLFDPSGNGRCGDWSAFFPELLAVHGVSSDIVGFVAHASQIIPGFPNPGCILFGGSTPADAGLIFLVKNWNFVGAGTSGNPNFPYRRDVAASILEFNDLLGVPGQGNPDPPGWYWDHAINRYGGIFYDPSYGIGPFNTLQDYENSAIDGYAALTGTDAGVTQVLSGLGKTNNAGVQEICILTEETAPGSTPDLPEGPPPTPTPPRHP